MVSNSVQEALQRYALMCVCGENKRNVAEKQRERERVQYLIETKRDLSEINEPKQNKE